MQETLSEGLDSTLVTTEVFWDTMALMGFGSHGPMQFFMQFVSWKMIEKKSIGKRNKAKLKTY